MFSIRSARAAWPLALVALGFVTNTFLTCGTNLVALAIVAALTMRPATAAAVMLAIWGESEILGFTVFGYPHQPSTYAWGLALGGATLAATVFARVLARRGPVVAAIGTFAGYEAVLALFACARGEGLAEFSPAIIGQLVLGNALVALVAVAVYAALGAARRRAEGRPEITPGF